MKLFRTLSPAMRLLQPCLLALPLLLAACQRDSSPVRTTAHTPPPAPATPPPTVGPTVSKLPDTALPLGLPLAETRARCVLADGLIYTRILRGVALDTPPALPCSAPQTQSLQGGGRNSSTSNTGPWAFHILEIEPTQFRGSLKPVLSNDTIGGKETPSEMGKRHGALAAINVGFFIVGTSGNEITAEGLTGEPSGLMALDGELISEAVNTRVGMVWEQGDLLSLRFPSLVSALTLETSTGQSLLVDGINRTPGTLRNCGGVGGDLTTELPRQGKVCTDADEIIWFTPIYGTDTPAGEGSELVLDGTGKVTAVRPRGGPVPAGGFAIAAIGSEAAKLSAALPVGATATLKEVLTADAQPFVRTPKTLIMTGGPELIRDGAPNLQDKRDGFDPDDDPTYRTTFVSGQNPRTFAAVTTTGRILLIVVDGRQNTWSAGMPLEDILPVLQFFGVDRASNLDGGGSSAMSIAGTLVNKPSDGSERPVSDALLVMPP